MFLFFSNVKRVPERAGLREDFREHGREEDPGRFVDLPVSGQYGYNMYTVHVRTFLVQCARTLKW